MSKSYELFIHWKQGDEFADYLKDANGNTTKALANWADTMDARAQHLRELSQLFEGHNIEAEGGTHFIGFYGCENVLEEAVSKDLLQGIEFDDEEDDVGDSNEESKMVN